MTNSVKPADSQARGSGIAEHWIIRASCGLRLQFARYRGFMGRLIVGALYAVAMAAVVVGVDVLFFRGHVWERFAANVGIVLVAVAFYLRFLHHP
jgi:hypothetical protein